MKLHRAPERGFAGVAVVAVAFPALLGDRVRVPAAAGLPRGPALDVDAQNQLEPFVGRRLVDLLEDLRPRVAERAVVAKRPEHAAHVLAVEVAVDYPVGHGTGDALVVGKRAYHRRERLLRRAVEDLDELLPVAEVPVSADSPDVIYGLFHHLAILRSGRSAGIHLRHQERTQLLVAERGARLDRRVRADVLAPVLQPRVESAANGGHVFLFFVVFFVVFFVFLILAVRGLLLRRVLLGLVFPDLLLEHLEALLLLLDELLLARFHVLRDLHRLRLGERLLVKRDVLGVDLLEHDGLRVLHRLLHVLAKLLLVQVLRRLGELLLDLLHRRLRVLLHLRVVPVQDVLDGLYVLLHVRGVANLRLEHGEIVLWSRLPVIAVYRRDHRALRIEHDDGRESLHAVLLRDAAVVLPARLGKNLRVHRVVDVHELVRVRRDLEERVLRQYLLVELLAPAAPVAAAEHGDDLASVLRGAPQRGVQIVREALRRRRLRGSGKRAERGARHC